MNPRQIWIVLRGELAESIRSMRFVVLLVVALISASGATAIFAKVLNTIETEATAMMGAAAPDRPGTMTKTLLQSDRAREMIRGLVDDDALAEYLLSVSPVALFYGWLLMSMIPMLVALMTGGSVASDVGSGQCRFALLRTHRSEWAIGKLLSEFTLVMTTIAVGIPAVLLVAIASTNLVEPVKTALDLVRVSTPILFYAYAYVGLVVGISQLFRTSLISVAVSLVAVMGMGGVRLLAWAFENSDRDAVAMILRAPLPTTYQTGLWQPGVQSLSSIVMLFAIGTMFFALGHLRFLRRDA